jgi:hypothetical protein
LNDLAGSSEPTIVTFEEGGEPAPESGRPEIGDVALVVGLLRAQDGRWSGGEPVTVGAAGWRPELVREDPPAVLHVHLADRMRPYIVERLGAAAQLGQEVHVGLPLEQLYDEAVLEDLARLDVIVHVIRQGSVDEPAGVLTAVADNGIRVSGRARNILGRIALELSRQPANNHTKGRRFEGLLLFLLSQIQDFRVREHNYRTDTEELDGVIQQTATGGRLWAVMGAPFVLLEAKNWARPVDQPVVSVFRVKMQGRRRSTRIGLLCGATGFTSDARDQELRFASDELTIVFLGPKELETWIEADSGDDCLETIVRHSMLR